MSSPILVAITDVEQASEDAHLRAYSVLARELPSGSFLVQLRDRRPAGRVVPFGRRLQGELGVPLVVNDRLDVARVLGTKRVHLGRASVSIWEARAYLGEDAWISVAAHGVAEASCLAGRVDAALLSPIFASPGKGAPLGTDAIRKWREIAPEVPVLALGGVDAENAARCIEAGAVGIAVIRAALDEHAARRLAASLGRR